MLFASAVSLRPSAEAGVYMDRGTRKEIVRQLEREMDMPANRKDFFYSGSMVHVNEVNSLPTYILSVPAI